MAAFIPQDMDSPIQEIELERHNMEEGKIMCSGRDDRRGREPFLYLISCVGIRALLSPPSIYEAKQLREHYILKHKNVGEFVLFFFEKKPYAPVSIATFDTINFRASQIGLQPLRGDAVLLSGIKNPHLCLLMRSELVALSPTPLSPDAFSLFNQSDPEAVSHNNEGKWFPPLRLTSAFLKNLRVYIIVIAGYKLINRQIELLAHRLLIGEEIPLHSEELSRCLHSYGINMRYLGKLRNFVRSSYRISALLLNEIVARVCKHFIREKLRLVQSPSLEEYQNVVANYFNVIFGSSEISNIYWCILLKGLVWLKYGAYGEPLTSRERRESFDFRKEEYYRPYALFLTLQMQTGVRLSSANEARRWFREGKTPTFLGKDVSFSVKQKSFFEKEPLGEAFQKSVLAETSSPSILLRIQTISESLPLSARIHLAFNFATNYELALTGEPVKMIKLLWKVAVD
jgi:hypothetical protein